MFECFISLDPLARQPLCRHKYKEEEHQTPARCLYYNINVQTDMELFSKNQGRFTAPDRIAQCRGQSSCLGYSPETIWSNIFHIFQSFVFS